MSRACGAEHGIEKATRDIQHLLFAALRVLNDETQDGTTEEDRKLVIETLLECAQGAGEGLERSIKALWGVTTLYLWPTNPRAWEAAQVERVEAGATEQQE